jgi:hypothetical protein
MLAKQTPVWTRPSLNNEEEPPADRARRPLRPHSRCSTSCFTLARQLTARHVRHMHPLTCRRARRPCSAGLWEVLSKYSSRPTCTRPKGVQGHSTCGLHNQLVSAPWGPSQLAHATIHPPHHTTTCIGSSQTTAVLLVSTIHGDAGCRWVAPASPGLRTTTLLPPALHAAHLALTTSAQLAAAGQRLSVNHTSCSRGHSLPVQQRGAAPVLTRTAPQPPAGAAPAAVRVKTVHRNSPQAQSQPALPNVNRRGGGAGGKGPCAIQWPGLECLSCSPQDMPACPAPGA